MDLMEHKIVDYVYPWQIEHGDIIKIGDELFTVEKTEDEFDQIRIFFIDEYGESDVETFATDVLIPIWLPFD